jgi:hypothetical protein
LGFNSGVGTRALVVIVSECGNHYNSYDFLHILWLRLTEEASLPLTVEEIIKENLKNASYVFHVDAVKCQKFLIFIPG